MVEERQRHRSFPTEDTTTGPWENYPGKSIGAIPQLPPGWNPEGKPGHGPGDIALQYPRQGGAYEMGSGIEWMVPPMGGSGKILGGGRNRIRPDPLETNRPVQKTHFWPTHLGNRYRDEAFNEYMGVNMSGYPEDEFGGFVEDYGNPHADRFPWELEPEWTGETSPFFPPLTIGDYPTGEFGEEIIEEDNGSFDIWDFIQRFFPGGVGAKGIGTLLENR